MWDVSCVGCELCGMCVVWDVSCVALDVSCISVNVYDWSH